MFVPDRRTLMVLATLIGAMTLASAALLTLEPRASLPESPTVVLSSLDGTADPDQGLFNTAVVPDTHTWSAIVIQQSGSVDGSGQSLGRLHEKLGLGGLAHHFVIGNGHGSPDGQIEAGFRWDRQVHGAFRSGIPTLDPHALGICLIGDGKRQEPTEAQFRQLVWLVRKLQTRFHIPADRVIVQSPAQPGGVSALFPVTGFRQQLWTVAAP